ncbi:MAG: HlyD family efflux transporter periplasmic adaptor subunit [Oscillatoriales cyanobacterium SM2_2_1]|nr:HlyD family efflux transporter periplasmic adaptor subunit [Oscillatoriales cyanobacterium SM2_2_1]
MKIEQAPTGNSGKALRYLVLAAAVTGVGATVALFFLWRPAASQSTDPVNRPVVLPQEAAVSALGRLEPEGEVVRVAAPSTLGTARIIKLNITEGQQVSEGEVLAVLDGYERAFADLVRAQSQAQEGEQRLAQVLAGAKSGDIAAQRQNVLAAEANVRAAEANVQRLRAELVVAERDRRRYDQLLSDGAVSASQRDSFVVRADSLAEQVRQAEQVVLQASKQQQQSVAILDSISEVRPTDVALAESQLATAIAAVQRAEADLELTQVRAPKAGQILKVYAKKGELVSQANGVAEMGNTKQMFVVAEVYETDVGRVQRGQKALISSDGRTRELGGTFSGELAGTVTQVGLRVAKNDVLGTDPATRTDVRVVEVRIRLTPEDSAKVGRLTNSQVRVRILAAKAK